MISKLDILLRLLWQGQAGTAQAKSSLTQLKGLAQELGMTLGLAGATGAMIAFGKASFIAAAQNERMARATSGLAAAIGETQASMMNAIVTSSKGMIEGTDAMAVANKAMLTEMATSSEQMGELTRDAIILGQALGMDAKESMENFTTALEYQQPRLLRRMGILLDATTAQEIYAASIGKTVEQLNDAEKEQAFYVVALQKASDKVKALGGDVTIDTLARLEKLTTSWTEFQEAFGALLTDAGLIQSLDDLVISLREGAEAWSRNAKTSEAGPETGKAMGLATWSTRIAATVGMVPSIITGQSISKSASNLAAWAQYLGIVTIDTEKLTEELGLAAKAESDSAQKIADRGAALKGQMEVEALALAATKQHNNAITAGRELQTELDKITKGYEKDRTETVTEGNKARAESDKQYHQAEAEALEDRARGSERQMRDFLRAQTQEENARNKQRMEAARDHGREEERAEEDHQKAMRRLRQDYDIAQEDAVAGRDALAFLRNARSYDLARSRAEEDFSDAASLRDEEYAQQLADQDQQYQDMRAERLAEFELQRADQDADWEYARSRNEERHVQDMAKMDADQADRLAKMDTAKTDETNLMYEGFHERLGVLGYFNTEYLALEKARIAAAEKLLRDAVAPSQNVAGGYAGRQAGGYAGLGRYTLGEAGREFVLGAGTTRVAEGLLGGALSQDKLLAMLAANQAVRGGGSFSQSVTIGGSEVGYTGLLAAIRAQTVSLLQEYARG